MSSNLLGDRIIRQAIAGTLYGRKRIERDERHAIHVVKRLMLRLRLMTKVKRFARRGVVRDSVLERRIHPLRVNMTLSALINSLTPDGWEAKISYSRPFGDALIVRLEHLSPSD